MGPIIFLAACGFATYASSPLSCGRCAPRRSLSSDAFCARKSLLEVTLLAQEFFTREAGKAYPKLQKAFKPLAPFYHAQREVLEKSSALFDPIIRPFQSEAQECIEAWNLTSYRNLQALFFLMGLFPCSDRGKLLAGIEKNPSTILYASKELLEDPSFYVEALQKSRNVLPMIFFLMGQFPEMGKVDVSRDFDGKEGVRLRVMSKGEDLLRAILLDQPHLFPVMVPNFRSLRPNFFKSILLKKPELISFIPFDQLEHAIPSRPMFLIDVIRENRELFRYVDGIIESTLGDGFISAVLNADIWVCLLPFPKRSCPGKNWANFICPFRFKEHLEKDPTLYARLPSELKTQELNLALFGNDSSALEWLDLPTNQEQKQEFLRQCFRRNPSILDGPVPLSIGQGQSWEALLGRQYLRQHGINRPLKR